MYFEVYRHIQMSSFPYECPHCGGGYSRCGNLECTEENCPGSGCWEDLCVAEVAEDQPYLTSNEKKQLTGVVSVKCEYSGKGYAIAELFPNFLFVEPERASSFVKAGGRKKKQPVVVATLVCLSCTEEEGNEDEGDGEPIPLPPLEIPWPSELPPFPTQTAPSFKLPPLPHNISFPSSTQSDEQLRNVLPLASSQ